MKIIRVLYVQTWRAAFTDLQDGAMLEEHQCETEQEVEQLIEHINARHWSHLDAISIRVSDASSNDLLG